MYDAILRLKDVALASEGRLHRNRLGEHRGAVLRCVHPLEQVDCLWSAEAHDKQVRLTPTKDLRMPQHNVTEIHQCERATALRCTGRQRLGTRRKIRLRSMNGLSQQKEDDEMTKHER